MYISPGNLLGDTVLGRETGNSSGKGAGACQCTVHRASTVLLGAHNVPTSCCSLAVARNYALPLKQDLKLAKEPTMS
jgi:hypothetical protein